MRRFLTIFLFTIPAFAALAQRAVPPLWGHRVHDEANALSEQTVETLEEQLKQHEDSTTNQIAVLIIPSLDGDDLDQYALRVAEGWKLGTANNDNGVLLLIVVNDRKMRIEVGSGLEGVLPDAIASRIIRNEIAPHFREHQYDDGVRAGIDAIISAIKGEYTAGEEDGSQAQADLSLKERLLIGAFIFGILGVFTFLGLFVPGCAGWFMYAFLIPFYAVFPMVVLGPSWALGVLGLYIVGFPIARSIVGKTSWGKNMIKNMANTRSSGGGWSGGSGWSGRSSGGGWSSGGGFSGGGGSFGGGGSSGSW